MGMSMAGRIVVLTENGAFAVEEVKVKVIEESRQFIVKEWDDTLSKVTAYVREDGYVDMIYEDGVCHTVNKVYFESIAFEGELENQKQMAIEAKLIKA
ncbi:MAG: hypothetical protein K0R00_53 [Herbinix sp.]|nr:hypothetical protein [Herbinix sp.]